MAFTTMHFAVGMACGGAAAGVACLALRRGWRWVPAAMTGGGVWAIVPDLPRIWREDFPSLPLASVLGSRSLEDALHAWGNLFCFHAALDAQPREFALHGLALILVLYNVSLALLLWLEHRQRHSIGNRAWRAHAGRNGMAGPVRRDREALDGVKEGPDGPPRPLLYRTRATHLSRAG